MTSDVVAGPKASALSSGAWWSWLVVAALLTVHAALAIDTLRRKAVTVDEVAHLPAGLSYWQTGHFALYHHNPPLIRLLTALPVLATGKRVDLEHSPTWRRYLRGGVPPSQWNVGWEFMYANAADYQDIYVRARLVVVALSVLAGLCMFLWCRELFGAPAALIGVALWSFSPNAIAHAGLVTTDMGAAVAGFVATYVFWQYLCRPGRWRAVAAGVMLGLAQLTKFSLLLLYPVWGLLAVVGWLRSCRRPGGPVRAGHLAVILLLSVLVINAGYGFEGTCEPLGRYTFLSRLLTRARRPGNPPPPVPAGHPWRELIVRRQNRFGDSWLGRLPVPLPHHYVAGFDEQKLESEGIAGQGYPVYLCGRMQRSGWWWYYLFALAVKVPLGTWLLTVLAWLAWWRRRLCRLAMADELALVAWPAALLLVMSFVADIDLGLRYVLPVFPFWFVWLSRVGVLAGARRGWALPLLLVLALGSQAAACRFHPHHLAYFNELAGGPDRGGRLLIDSNLDWGQDLLGLQGWLQQHQVRDPIWLAYFGNVDPSILSADGGGIRFRLAPPRQVADLELAQVARSGKLRSLQLARAAELLESGAGRPSPARYRAVADQVTPARLWSNQQTRAEIVNALGLAAGPQPGLYAVSANFVYGLPFRVRDQEGNLWQVREGAYTYLQALNPEALVDKIGYSIFIYRVSRQEAGRLRRQLGLPTRLQ